MIRNYSSLRISLMKTKNNHLLWYRENAHAEVVELSQHLKAPVGYSFRGKMSMQHDDPNEVGMTGLLGLPSAYNSMCDSDLILLFGTDFPYQAFMPEKIKLHRLT